MTKEWVTLPNQINFRKSSGGHEARDEHSGGEEPGNVLARETLAAGPRRSGSCTTTTGDPEAGGTSPKGSSSLPPCA